MDIKSPAHASPATVSEQQISIADLAGRLYRKRKGRGMTLEQASEQIGVSAATLSRLERLRDQDSPAAHGRESIIPDTRTLTAITRWLDVPLGRVVRFQAPDEAAASIEGEGGSVPDKVEAHLRADRNLDDESALALTQMFRMAYDQFSRLRQTRVSSDTNNSPMGPHTKEE